MKKLHIMNNGKRTTVSISDTLYALMALAHGVEPHQKSAHEVVRGWLQETADRSHRENESGFSQGLVQEIILQMVGDDLSRQYWRWQMEQV